MSKVEIYTKIICPFCNRAKDLLNTKGIKFKEIPIDNNTEKLEEMIKRSGYTTVPQIFINNSYIGGYDNLYALNKSGKLDLLIE